MGLSRKVIVEIIMLTVILAFIGFFMQEKVEKLLTASVEHSVARQTADFSALAEERFNKELAELQYAAKYLENSENGFAVAYKSMEELNRRGVVCGIFAKDSGAVVGEALSLQDFKQLIRAFSGTPIVDYSAGKGLLFAAPVFSGDNVRYVIYRLYSEDVLYEYFGLEEYDADSRILIRERNGAIIVPYRGFGEEDMAFFEDAKIKEGFEKIREKLNSGRSAAVYTQSPKGRFFLFGADLPRTNCSMVGYVPWEAVAGNMSGIYTLVFTVVTLLLLLFATASAYLFMTQASVAETESIKKAKEIADRANRAKSDFLASMSHEIRTPINAVLGMNEMILRESKEKSTLDYAKNITAAGRSLLALINDILDFSKIEAGRMELVEANYRLDSLISDVVTVIEPRAKGKNLEFTVEIDENLPVELFGDMVRIKQIMLNFLTNAVKYTPKGSVTFRVNSAKTETGGFALMINATDTGIGIKPEDREKLFGKFERLDRVKNQGIEGTGLGMAITAKLIELMGGKLEFESVYGAGSSFSAYLPQKIINAAPIGKFISEKQQEENKRYTASFCAPDAKILVVDDNEVNLLVTKNLLKNTKVQVTTCLSGKECLQKIQENFYHIILMDQMMPEMDGIETLKRAKNLTESKCQNSPIIALTANAISGAKEMFLAEGFSDYLTKPIMPEKLEAAIKKYLPEDILKTEETPETTSETADKKEEPAEETSGGYIDYNLGMQYNGGMEEMYKAVLAMFAEAKDEKISNIQQAFDEEDWHNYTIYVHALKSTALTIGAKKLSEAAKALELAGKKYQAADSSNEEKTESLEYIRKNNADVMSLYEKVAKEAKEKV